MERHVSLLCTCCHHKMTSAELLAFLPYMMLASMLLYVVWELPTLVSQSAF